MTELVSDLSVSPKQRVSSQVLTGVHQLKELVCATVVALIDIAARAILTLVRTKGILMQNALEQTQLLLTMP